MANVKSGPQDMPPPGGYNPLQTVRTKLRTYVTGPRIVGLFAVSQIYAWYNYYYDWARVRKLKMEKRSARFVIHNLLTAEKDRLYLKQLRRNRDIEAELMKDYPDWEVGTLFGFPIYETVDPNEEWQDISYIEYLVHSDHDKWSKRQRYHLLT